MEKELDVVMLPSDDLNGFAFVDSQSGKLCLSSESIKFKDCSYQHIYILSDDKIEKGDWWVDLALADTEYMAIRNCKLSGIERIDKNCKKIIASSDSSLNLPQLPNKWINKFINEFNNGSEIKKTRVEFNVTHVSGAVDIEDMFEFGGYDIISLKTTNNKIVCQ